MYTACRRNDYFGFSITLDCTEGLTKPHSPLRRLGGGKGHKDTVLEEGGSCSASTAAGSFGCLLPH